MMLSPLGDSAIVLTLGDTVDEAMLGRVRAVAEAIQRRPPAGVIEIVPAFASVTVFVDLARAGDYGRLWAALAAFADVATDAECAEPRRREIPVCYDLIFGPDMDHVVASAGKSRDEVVALHSGARYRVHAIGFAPGFAYLGGLPEAIHTPRRPTPRTRVEAGTVGIGGSQTGVYPLMTPGGWNLIGRTPLRMFDATREEPALLRVGDEVAFRPISAEEFAARAVDSVPRGEPVAQITRRKGRVEIEIKKAGMFTTVQDLGRRGHRASGVPLSGAADPVALRVANLLVGNPDDAAALEFTLVGPELRFSSDALVAVAGAEFEGWPRGEPIRIEAGRSVKFGPARRGCRGYLAVAGGLEIGPVLGSRSTYVRAALGGHEGRALRDGDVVFAAAAHREIRGRWHLDERIFPAYAENPVVRVVRGAQADEFDPAFFEGRVSFRVSSQSDRMGVRLSGDALQRRSGSELRSAVVVPGTIQVPPDGHPIVLLADAQTLGGYPQVAHVISVDLPLVAQLRPGDAVRFTAVSPDNAHQLAFARERALGMLREGLAEKVS